MIDEEIGMPAKRELSMRNCDISCDFTTMG